MSTTQTSALDGTGSSQPARRDSAGSAAATILTGAGAALLCVHLGIAYLSRAFPFEGAPGHQPILAFVGLELLAATLFLLSVRLITSRSHSTVPRLGWILLVGLALRATMMESTPVLEHDYYRYLWDGAVLSNGMNPFEHAPRDAMESAGGTGSELSLLGTRSHDVVSRISFPELRTIYPPIAQLAFAFAHMVSPWSLLSWRFTIALFDLATLVLILAALRSLQLPVSWCLIYWWNPLLVLEAYNTAHMDVVVLPFAVAALFLTVRGRIVWASLLLALGVGAKLWPVVLLPLILRPAAHRPKLLVSSLFLFAATVGALFLPVYLGKLDEGSGFVAYARHWEMNDGLYRLLALVVTRIFDVVSPDSANAPTAIRVAALGFLLAWTAWVCRSEPSGALQQWDRALLVVAATFLLSPAQFPWYYLWVTPFLALSPRPSLLFLNCSLILYYSVYYFRGIGAQHLFDTYIPWVEYLPFWVIVAWERFRTRA